MEIIKSDGASAAYDPEKIRGSLRRIGANDEVIEKVLAIVETKLVEGMASKKLFSIVRKALTKVQKKISSRYNLRDSLLKLGPAGFSFEKYIASILAAYGYTTEIPHDDLPGLCTHHEIDVTAKKDGRRIMIEAKFRNRNEDNVILKDVMATWARFNDINDGADKNRLARFDEIWVVTNGKFSDRATQFGDCKKMHLIDWKNTEESLAKMVDHAALYPITILDSVNQFELDAFAKQNVMLCRELALRNPHEIAGQTGISGPRAEKIVEECKNVIGGK